VREAGSICSLIKSFRKVKTWRKGASYTARQCRAFIGDPDKIRPQEPWQGESLGRGLRQPAETPHELAGCLTVAPPWGLSRLT